MAQIAAVGDAGHPVLEPLAPPSPVHPNEALVGGRLAGRRRILHGHKHLRFLEADSFLEDEFGHQHGGQPLLQCSPGQRDFVGVVQRKQSQFFVGTAGQPASVRILQNVAHGAHHCLEVVARLLLRGVAQADHDEVG